MAKIIDCYFYDEFLIIFSMKFKVFRCFAPRINSIEQSWKFLAGKIEYVLFKWFFYILNGFHIHLRGLSSWFLFIFLGELKCFVEHALHLHNICILKFKKEYSTWQWCFQRKNAIDERGILYKLRFFAFITWNFWFSFIQSNLFTKYRKYTLKSQKNASFCRIVQINSNLPRISCPGEWIKTPWLYQKTWKIHPISGSVYKCIFIWQTCRCHVDAGYIFLAL